MPATTRSKASRGADQAGRDQHLSAVPDEQPKPPEPKPEISIEPTPVTYYKPVVTFPDGHKVECEHKYLHETEKVAAACGRRIAAAGKFVK